MQFQGVGMKLPIDVRDIMKSSSQMQEMRDKEIRIAVLVKMDAPDELVELVEEKFHPYASNARLHVDVVEPDVEILVDSSVDVVIGLVGSGRAGIAGQLKAVNERAIPTVAVAMADGAAEMADSLGHPYRDTLANADVMELIEEELGEWLVERLPDKRLAMAHNFEFMRRAVAVEAVKGTAWQNGAIGVVAIIPGADMPLMTANQIKMLMQIAAAYGEALGLERLKELAAIVGGGFLLRLVARQALAFAPGFGWAIKGSIGVSGTLAMGYAAISYFEGGADLGNLQERFDKIKESIDKRRLNKRDAEEILAKVDETGDLVAISPLPSAEGSFFGEQ